MVNSCWASVFRAQCAAARAARHPGNDPATRRREKREETCSRSMPEQVLPALLASPGSGEDSEPWLGAPVHTRKGAPK